MVRHKTIAIRPEPSMGGLVVPLRYIEDPLHMSVTSLISAFFLLPMRLKNLIAFPPPSAFLIYFSLPGSFIGGKSKSMIGTNLINDSSIRGM